MLEQGVVTEFAGQPEDRLEHVRAQRSFVELCFCFLSRSLLRTSCLVLWAVYIVAARLRV